ncbi:MAG: GAF domain-containing protein [Chloroflexi bacterium]|nr:GAF domain-containing protein [Chloroflexota bacterium]
MDRQQEILRAIAFTSHYLSDVRNLDGRLPAVLANLARAVGVRRAYIYDNLEEADGRILSSHRLGWSAYRQYMLQNDPNLSHLSFRDMGYDRWTRLFQTGQAAYGSITQFPAAEIPFLAAQGIHSIAAIPILNGDQLWGFIGFDDYERERPWTSGEIQALTYVGRAMGTAYENARLFRAEAQRRREAEILNEVSSYLTHSLDLEEALDRTLDTLLRHLGGALTISLTLLDKPQQALLVVAQKTNCPQPHSFYEMVGQQIDLTELQASRWVIEKKRPYTIANLTGQEAASPKMRQAVDDGLRAVLYLPLLVRSQPIGVLHIDVHTTPRIFSPEEITLCQGIANLMAAALERSELLKLERQQLYLARTLQQVGALLTTQLSLEDVYQKVFDLLAQVIHYDSVSIQLFDEEQDKLYMVAGIGFPNETIVREFIYSIAEHCLSKFPDEQYVVMIPDTQLDSRWVTTPELNYTRSWVGALLRVKGHSIGILNVDSKQANAFDEQATATIAAFANQAAIAIENARLYENARQQADELAILHEVTVSTSATVDIDELFAQTTHLLVSRIYHDSFGFILVDEAAELASPHPSYFGISEELLHKPIPLAHSITGLVVQTGTAVVIPDVRQEPRYWKFHERYRSSIMVPLKVDAQVVGVIVAESARVNDFTEDDMRFLITLAGLVGVAMVRTRLYKRLQEQSDRLAQQVTLRTVELQSEKERTETILESAGESILVTDLQARIVYANRAAEVQSGYSRAEMLGTTPRLLESGLTPQATYVDMWRPFCRASNGLANW